MMASSCGARADLAIDVSDDMYLAADQQLVSDQRASFEASLFIEALPVDAEASAEILGPRQILSNAYVNELARVLVANTGDIHDLVRAHDFSDLTSALVRYEMRALYARADDRTMLARNTLMFILGVSSLGEGLVLLALMQADMLDIPGGGVSLSAGPDGVTAATVIEAAGAETQIRLAAASEWQYELREVLSAVGATVAVDGPDWPVNGFLNVVGNGTISTDYKAALLEFMTSIDAARS